MYWQVPVLLLDGTNKLLGGKNTMVCKLRKASDRRRNDKENVGVE